MDRSEKLRRIYAVVIGVLIVAAGIAIICVAADIYYSGKGTGVIYTREIVSDRLQKLAIPLLFVAAAAIAGAVFPIFKTRVKPKAEDAVAKLRSRMPQNGDGEQFDAAKKSYDKYGKIRLIVWACSLSFACATAIAVMAAYVFKAANFAGKDISAEMLRLVSVVMPCTAAALAALIAASVVGGALAKKQLAALKIMIKHGDGSVIPEPKFIAKAKSVWNSDITLWAVRGVILAIGVVFIIVGALNGGARDVLVKAINICQECIGLG